MQLLTVEAHNILGLSDVSCDFTGTGLFLVGGDNEQGKTSLLRSLLMALCGRSGMDWPDVSLKEGEDEGWVKLDLSGDEELHDNLGFSIELLLTRQRGGQVVEKFRLVDSAGEPAPEPRTLLKALYHYRGFDPLAFSRMDKAEQRKLLMELCGIDFSADDIALKDLYEQRKEVNRDLKKASVECESVPTYKDVPAKEVSTSDLMTKLEERQKYNAETDGIVAAADAELLEASQIKVDIAEQASKIASLKAEIATREETVNTLSDAAVKSHERWTELTKQFASRQKQDVDSIRTEIKDAGATNKKIASNIKAAAAREKMKELKKKSDTLTANMEDIKAAQQKRLKEAKWPVAELSIDDAGVLFNGLPFEQASTMRRTLVSAEIGMALNPKLRLLVCEGGGDLGNSAIDALAALCKERDFQMVVEIVTRSQQDEARCAVVIENGKVKKSE